MMLVERKDGTFNLSSYDGERSRILERAEGVELAKTGNHDLSLVDPVLIELINKLGVYG